MRESSSNIQRWYFFSAVWNSITLSEGWECVAAGAIQRFDDEVVGTSSTGLASSRTCFQSIGFGFTTQLQ